eukprot:RCo039323
MPSPWCCADLYLPPPPPSLPPLSVSGKWKKSSSCMGLWGSCVYGICSGWRAGIPLCFRFSWDGGGAVSLFSVPSPFLSARSFTGCSLHARVHPFFHFPLKDRGGPATRSAKVLVAERMRRGSGRGGPEKRCLFSFSVAVLLCAARLLGPQGGIGCPGLRSACLNWAPPSSLCPHLHPHANTDTQTQSHMRTIELLVW